MLMPEFSSGLKRLGLKRKPYAVKSIPPTRPVLINETMAILHRLAKKYWPGPLTIHIRLPKDHDSSVAATLPHQSRFVGIMNPAHPLAHKFLSSACADDEVVVGIPTRFQKASHVWTHYARQKRSSIHVLNGEDQRELFAVPTCQLAPISFSLWVDESSRILYIKGMMNSGEEENELVKELQRALLTTTSSTGEQQQSKEQRHRSRVTSAVLRQWSIVDQRK